MNEAETRNEGALCTGKPKKLKTFKITSKGAKANELLDHLKQQRGNDKEMKKEKNGRPP